MTGAVFDLYVKGTLTEIGLSLGELEFEIQSYKEVGFTDDELKVHRRFIGEKLNNW